MCRIGNFITIKIKHRTADTACENTVAIAAPATPHFKLIIQKISKKIFSTAEIAKKINGVLESPIARKILDK